ncbi:MAG: GDSL-type esterase/lipase family protein [Planctomycetota bacterium]
MSPRIPRLIGGAIAVVAVLCSPPVAEQLFALTPLHAADVAPLWAFSAGLLFAGALIAFVSFPGRPPIAALGFAIAGLVGVELIARVVIGQTEATRWQLVKLANQTYPELSAYRAHPFLHFTGRPGNPLDGNAALGGLPPCNEDGFFGPAIRRAKGRNVIRVACLGGSTTATGYPGRVREMLTKEFRPRWFGEVINYGMGWYTSAHSAVNFILNAVDYSPDYVVFHHAWNDGKGRGLVQPMRGDYSHFLKPFEIERPKDALLVRSSVIYRLAKTYFGSAANSTSLDAAVLEPIAVKAGPRYDDLRELDYYARNVRTIVAVARANDIVPVLTTQPHCGDTRPPGSAAEHIDQCNARMRELAAEFGDEVLFVDLAAQILPTQGELFVDLGHMTREGIRIKGEAIGAVIVEDWRRRH